MRMMTLDLPPSRFGQDLRLNVPDPSTVDSDAFATAVVRAMSDKQLFVHAFEHYPISRSPMQSNYLSKINHILMVYASRPIDGVVNTLFLAFSNKTGETATLVRAECYVNLKSEQPCIGVLIPAPRRDGSHRLREGDPAISPQECNAFTRQFIKTGPIDDAIILSSGKIVAFEERQILKRVDTIYDSINGIRYSRYSNITQGMIGCTSAIEESENGR